MASPSKTPALRWRIITIVSLAVAVSYLDRQALPVAIKAIEQDIPISNQQFSLLQTSFLLTYAIMYAFGGKLVDILGTRRGFMIVMVFWSVACLGHGFATSFAMLAICRLLLGAGEGGGFPAATRAMAEWFPARERTRAMGIINTGSAVGMIAAPLLITGILLLTSWRWVFVICGVSGLVWTLWWRKVYHPPEKHPHIGAEELKLLGDTVQPTNVESESEWSLAELLKLRATWGLLIAKFFSDAAWYFYLFWLPKYLYEAHDLDIKSVGAFSWIPPVGAGIGSFFGGWFCAWLLHRHLTLNAARKVALGVSAAVMPFMLLVPAAPIGWAVAFFCGAYFGHQFWATILMTLPADLFPKTSTGTAAGLMGCAGGLGGVVFGQLVAVILDHGPGWSLVFTLGGLLHVLSFVVICFFLPRIEPLVRRESPAIASPQLAQHKRSFT